MKTTNKILTGASIIFSVLLLLSFQNCSQTKFSAANESYPLNAAGGPDTKREASQSIGTPTSAIVNSQANETSQTQNLIPTSPNVAINSGRTPASNSTGSPANDDVKVIAAQESAEAPGVKIGVTTIGLSYGVISGVVMNEHEGAVLRSYFPSDPRNSWKGDTTELLALDAESDMIGQTVEVCIAKSLSGCGSPSNFRSLKFGSAAGGSYAAVTLENFWQTTRLREFGDYHIVVKAGGLTRRALIEHRVHISYTSGGFAPSGVGFYSTTVGPNRYGFICEEPPAHEIGWKLYPYGSFANHAVRKNPYLENDCYYRVLTGS